MAKAPLPYNESARLKDLFEYDILDTPEEDDYDDIVWLASNICNTPISFISLVDANRQWFKARLGISATETSRDISFCSHAILNGDLFIVPDATKDQRFFDNPFVTGDPDIRFYAGVPLVSPRGGNVGTLCVLDRVPRELTEEKKQALVILGKQVVKLMELRRINASLKTITLQERTQREQLELISAQQKKMMSILAHDIRSPLFSLKSVLQLLPEKNKGFDEFMSMVEMAGRQLNVTLSLLDNIVDWGLLQLEKEPPGQVDLQEIAGEVLEELAIQAAMKGLTLVNRVGPTARLAADGNSLRFILRNLLTNAIKFTNAGTIAVDATRTNGTILFTVADTGIGMPPPMLEQLFMAGVRSSRKGTQNESGSGLGLSLVKEFVTKMNGVLTVRSEVGRGTSIAIELPLHP